jgi:formylglycine-generating enzyme required for sulfatase activity
MDRATVTRARPDDRSLTVAVRIRATLRRGLLGAAALVVPSACATLVGDFDVQATGGGSSSSIGSGGGTSTASSGTGGAPCLNAATDCPKPATACLTVTCSMGVCGTTGAALGTSCTDSGGKVCDGDGKCVVCNAVAECPKPATACVTATCTVGVCGTTNAAAGTPCTDSGGHVCGGGKCVPCNVPADCPAPATACVLSTCTGGVCGTTSAAMDAPCTDNGGKFCDGAGTCLGCHVDTDCATFPAQVCQANFCVAATCTDSKIDGDETGYDCGGSCAPCVDNAPCKVNADCQSGLCDALFCTPCAASAICGAGRYCDVSSSTCAVAQSNGAGCGADEQCASGHCVDGVCCGAASCPACNACDLSGLGTCSPTPAGPDTTAPGTCSDATHTCDGLGTCLKVQGQPCAADGECASGHCVDLVCCGAASCPACNACNLDGAGDCSPMATGPDATAPSTCSDATHACDGAGSCKKSVGQGCASGGECATGVCTTSLCAARAPSCVGGGSGAGNDCGASGTGDCCASLSVPGGMFKRGYDGVTNTDASSPATVSSFRLDKYEVTVGRFRKFVAAVLGGWLPAPGSGKHTHLAGGGLNAGAEQGWDATWNANLPGVKAAWDAALPCSWTPSPGGSEKRPLSCVRWPLAYAFCIWDGGFLPSEAEWNYAAAGGSEQRVYPWSSPPTATTIDCTYANFFNAGMPCAATSSNDVGSESPKGDGRWGHADLAGNLWEATLDGFASYPLPCNDCATLVAAPNRVARGGGFLDSSGGITSSRLAIDPGFAAFDPDVGFRCARTP